jgi:hypothetical protein
MSGQELTKSALTARMNKTRLEDVIDKIGVPIIAQTWSMQSLFTAKPGPVDGIPDPHYHVHVFAMNATFDEIEKEWKALEVGNTVGDRTFYEAYFHHLLAAKLEACGVRNPEN